MRTLLFAALLAAAAPARALQTDVGTAAAQFLTIGAGARSLGMGEAYTAVADGPDAVYWNPAGLGGMTRPEVSYSRTELPAGLHHDFLAYGMPVEFLRGTLAVAFTRLSQDSLAAVNAANQSQGSFAPHSEVYALAYGHNFAANDVVSTSRDYFREDWNIPRADRPFQEAEEPWTGELSAGVSIKALTENLGAHSASDFAIDGGGIFRPTQLPDLIVGGAIRNLGGKINFIADAEPLPTELGTSVAYDVRGEGWRLLPALEFDVPYAGNVYGKLGVEATKSVASGMSAAVRLGYDSRSVADLGALSGLTAGVGLQIGGFKFDAAFQPMSILGESFRLSVGWKF